MSKTKTNVMVNIKMLDEINGQARSFLLKNGKYIDVGISQTDSINNTVKCLIGTSLRELKNAIENKIPTNHILKNDKNYITISISDIAKII